MYLDYYNLKSKPFQINIEHKFFWSGKSMSTALLTLKKSILKDNGFFILTGDTGTGKTVLIDYIENILEDKTVLSKIFLILSCKAFIDNGFTINIFSPFFYLFFRVKLCMILS